MTITARLYAVQNEQVGQIRYGVELDEQQAETLQQSDTAELLTMLHNSILGHHLPDELTLDDVPPPSDGNGKHVLILGEATFEPEENSVHIKLDDEFETEFLDKDTLETKRHYTS